MHISIDQANRLTVVKSELKLKVYLPSNEHAENNWLAPMQS